MISTKESKEKPVNRPSKPPKLASKSIVPYSSFRCDVRNDSRLKNTASLEKCILELKRNSMNY